ncbi:MAG: PrsW family intramembrane metalloprotease [Lachnospirales bacterium]
MKIVFLAEAPILALSYYIFIRDKYEKEPISLLIIGLLFGGIIAFPILFTQKFLFGLFTFKYQILQDAYSSYIVAGLVEEVYKFIVLWFLIWFNVNYNERCDAIVYAVFISLGFAGVENYFYIADENDMLYKVSLLRAFISVPFHFIYATFMGYYLTLAKYDRDKTYLAIAVLSSVIIHGNFNFILSLDFYFTFIFVICYWLVFAFSSYHMMNELVEKSPFKKI